VARRIMDRRAMCAGRPVRLHRPMAKTETPKPPEHRTYPRGKAPAPPPAADKRVPLWTRAVPPDRSFPRA
jgi:hypothetical protein